MSTTPMTGRCYRHRPDLANKRVEVAFDLSLDKVSAGDRAAISHVWSLFSSAPRKQRDLILKGILSVCCMPQLSFIYESLQPLLRIDFVAILPRHVNLKIFSYLDATSLCQVSKVCKSWKILADDEQLWFMMCDQHTGKKCLKCGWGLSNQLQPTPLTLDDSNVHNTDGIISIIPANKVDFFTSAHTPSITQLKRSTSLSITNITNIDNNKSSVLRKRKHPSMSGIFGQFPKKKPALLSSSSSSPSSSLFPSSSSLATAISSSARPAAVAIPVAITREYSKDRKHVNANADKLHGSNDFPSPTNIWKSIYRERMILEQHWRQNRFIQRELCGTKNGVICIQICDDLQVIMIGYNDKTIHVYDDETNRPQAAPRKIMEMNSMINCFQFDEAKLIVGEENHSISIWDWQRGVKIRSLYGHSGPVLALHFNSRNILATGSMDHIIRIWDFQQSRSFTLIGHESPVRSVLLLPSSSSSSSSSQQQQLLVSAGDDTVIRIWGLGTQQCIRYLEGHYGGIHKLVAVPAAATVTKSLNNANHANDDNDDHPLILSCSSDNTIRLWDTITGKCLRTLFGHIDHVTGLACDQFRIVSGSKDKSLRTWSLDTGACQHIVQTECTINTLALSSCGILLAFDGIGCIWDYSATNDHER